MIFTRVSGAAAVGAMLVLAAACTAPAQPARPPRATAAATAPVGLPSPRAEPGALTQAEARRIHARFERLINRVSAARGAGVKQVEAGLALQIDQAQFRLGKLIGRQPKVRSRVTSVSFFIPRLQAHHVRWFVARVVYARSSSSYVDLVFQEQTQGWRMVAGTTTPRKRKMASIAVTADGLSTAVEQHARGLTASPRQLAQAHAASNATLYTDPQARALIAPGYYTSEEAADDRADSAVLRGQWTMQIHAQDLPDIYSLRTTDGGALTWYGVRKQLVYTAAIDGAARLSMAHNPYKTLSRGRSYSRQVTATSASWYLAVIPAATARATSKAVIVGDWWALLSMRGS
ncbi:hypothetical protein [Streptosporangium canum]|uniref:hypothetical protein n=1 Tax=Streptosporangium canum TaxID=324952 RepID=UPI0037A4D765